MGQEYRENIFRIIPKLGVQSQKKCTFSLTSIFLGFKDQITQEGYIKPEIWKQLPIFLNTIEGHNN